MTTMDQFRDTIQAVQKDMVRDNPDDHAMCHMLHHDLGFAETPALDAEEAAASVSAQLGEDVDSGDLDFTIEHAFLHEFLESVKLDALRLNMSITQILATVFAVGRRYGMREASGAFAHDEISLEDWLNNATKDIEDHPDNTVND